MEQNEDGEPKLQAQTSDKRRYRPNEPRNLKLVALGVLIGVALGAVVWLAFGPGRAWFGGSESIAPAVPKINSPAPDFQLTALDGSSVSLSELRGKAVMINFWATWCGPCRVEMPLLQKFYDQNKEDWVVLAVNNAEPQEKVQAFIDELELSLPVLLDADGEVTKSYHVRGFPTTLFIDQDGIIRYEHIGILNESLLEGYLQDLGVVE